MAFATVFQDYLHHIETTPDGNQTAWLKLSDLNGLRPKGYLVRMPFYIKSFGDSIVLLAENENPTEFDNVYEICEFWTHVKCEQTSNNCIFRSNFKFQWSAATRGHELFCVNDSTAPFWPTFIGRMSYHRRIRKSLYWKWHWVATSVCSVKTIHSLHCSMHSIRNRSPSITWPTGICSNNIPHSTSASHHSKINNKYSINCSRNITAPPWAIHCCSIGNRWPRKWH